MGPRFAQFVMEGGYSCPSRATIVLGGVGEQPNREVRAGVGEAGHALIGDFLRRRSLATHELHMAWLNVTLAGNCPPFKPLN